MFKDAIIVNSSLTDERKKQQGLKRVCQSFFVRHSIIQDIISTNNHSRDFIQTRNQYIVERLKLICLFFAVSVPASSILDFMVFEQAQAQLLLTNRLIFSGSLVMLYVLIRLSSKVLMTRSVLVLSFLFPMLFYTATELSLTQTMDYKDIPMSFALTPYLIVSMLGLFPLTVLGGVTVLAITTLPLAILEYIQYTDDVAVVIDKLWLLLLFGGISLWLQSGQLVMLMKLYRESTIDSLTGLNNRRVLMRQVEALIHNSDKEHAPISVIMFDLDHFKRINDTYGHMVGDKVLVKISSLLKREFSNADLIARFGGEEFLVVMPDATLDQAKQVAQRFSEVIHGVYVMSDNQQKVTFTSSIGVTQYRPHEPVASLFKRVDDLLYQAKSQGRDRIESVLK